MSDIQNSADMDEAAAATDSLYAMLAGRGMPTGGGSSSASLSGSEEKVWMVVGGWG